MNEIGHNGQLKAIVERIETVEESIKDFSNDRKEIYLEAKGNGFNPKAIREIVRRRRADAKALAEFESEVDAYMSALGM